MTSTMTINGCPSEIVWRVGDEAPSRWLSTGLDNNIIFLAWSYKTWGRLIGGGIVDTVLR